MHVDLLFPSLYLRAADLCGRHTTVEIDRVTPEELTMRGGSKKTKGVVYLRRPNNGEKLDKRLVLNRTNADTIVAMYGSETDNWIGRSITLFPAKASFGRETVDAIRVKQEQAQ